MLSVADIFSEPGFENVCNHWDFLNDQFNQAKTVASQYNQRLIMCAVDIHDPRHILSNPDNWLITNSAIDPAYCGLDHVVQFPDTWYGIYAGDIPLNTVMPVKAYNCFMSRMDVMRQSWLYQLLRRNIFNDGLISFNMDISRHVMENTCSPTATPTQIFEQQFAQQLSIFSQEHEIAKSLVPYRNFSNDMTLNDVILASKFSIVLETYFHTNYAITYTEKIFRCLKLPRPWIMFAMQYAIKNLKNLGFDVLDDVVDHSYDELETAVDRQVRMLDVAQDLCQLQFTPSLHSRLIKAASHNQHRLRELGQSVNQDIVDSFHCILSKMRPT